MSERIARDAEGRPIRVGDRVAVTGQTSPRAYRVNEISWPTESSARLDLEGIWVWASNSLLIERALLRVLAGDPDPDETLQEPRVGLAKNRAGESSTQGSDSFVFDPAELRVIPEKIRSEDVICEIKTLGYERTDSLGRASETWAIRSEPEAPALLIPRAADEGERGYDELIESTLYKLSLWDPAAAERIRDGRTRGVSGGSAHTQLTPVAFQVSSFDPPDDRSYPPVRVELRYPSKSLWAVTNGSMIADEQGRLRPERLPSNRDEDAISEHYFPFERAVEIARGVSERLFGDEPGELEEPDDPDTLADSQIPF